MVRMTGLEPARLRQRNLNPPSLPIPPHPHVIKLYAIRPVTVPHIFLGFEKPSSAIDHGHSLGSLHPPPAALPSLLTILPRRKFSVNGKCGRENSFSCRKNAKLCLLFVQFALTFRDTDCKILFGMVYAERVWAFPCPAFHFLSTG